MDFSFTKWFESLNAYKIVTLVFVGLCVHLLLRGVYLSATLQKNPAATGPAYDTVYVSPTMQVGGCQEAPLASDYLQYDCTTVVATCNNGVPNARKPVTQLPQPVCCGLDGCYCGNNVNKPQPITRFDPIPVPIKVVNTGAPLQSGGNLNNCLCSTM